jgi:hypothetical protein
MAVSVLKFQKAFPEFKDTDPDLVQEKLDAASLRTNEDVFSGNAVQAVMLLAAHLLSISPSGEMSRLRKENRVTMYWIELRQLKREMTMGHGRIT